MVASNVSVRDLQGLLRTGGYQLLRQKGSHQIWSDGKQTAILPVATLKPVIAQKIIKQCRLNT